MSEAPEDDWDEEKYLQEVAEMLANRTLEDRVKELESLCKHLEESRAWDYQLEVQRKNLKALSDAFINLSDSYLETVNRLQSEMVKLSELVRLSNEWKKDQELIEKSPFGFLIWEKWQRRVKNWSKADDAA